MNKCINITFPVKKKSKVDTYRTFADYQELGDNRIFILPETFRDLHRKHYDVTEGCTIEDLITGETFVCNKVDFTQTKAKYPILQVNPACLT